jgi:hypothetical protein
MVGFNFFGQLEGWFTKTRAWFGWKKHMDEGPPWLVAHK